MKECIIIGGGYSVKEGIEKGLFNKIKGKNVISINYAYKVMPFIPAIELWSDLSFFENNMQDILNLYNRGCQLYCKANSRYKIYSKVLNKIQLNQLLPTTEKKYKENLYFVGNNSLSGFLALSLAVKNYDRIYLLGYDWGGHPKNKTFTHFYQNDINVISTGIGKPKIYEINNQPVKAINGFNYYLQFHKQIYNVSLTSRIKDFIKITYEDFFKLIGNNEN